MSHLAFNVD